MRSLWVKKFGELICDGDIVSVVITTDEEPLLLRGKRSTAVAAAGVLKRGLDKEQRVAEVRPFKRKARPH